jgi:Bacterial SH3 domain
MNPSRLFRFLLGSTLGLMILGLGVVGIGILLVQRLSAPPPRPVFENEWSMQPTPSPAKKPVKGAKVSSPKPQNKVSYLATVSFPSGLSLRSRPQSDATRIGGVGFAEQVEVLETKADAEWIRVRVQSSRLEGWIKAGNIQRIEPEP